MLAQKWKGQTYSRVIQAHLPYLHGLQDLHRCYSCSVAKVQQGDLWTVADYFARHQKMFPVVLHYKKAHDRVDHG